MNALPELLSAAGPLLAAGTVLLPLAAALALPADARAAARTAPRAAWAAFAFAAVAMLALALHGTPPAARAGTVRPDALGVHLDAVSATMLLLVSFVGAIVGGYSRAYLDGDPRQRRFSRWMLLTLAAVLALVVSGNLVLLFAAWVATSLALHQLLVHYPERPGARLAARKKFLFGRLADLALLVALVLTARAFDTLDLATVLSRARELAAAGEAPPHADAIALLLALAAIVKSAQFPFHGWLPEVMETPTPVSALLHAGIINAGGFLLIRFSPLVAASGPALDLLIVVGAFTALFAAAVMLTQTSVKVSLAWSTCAQMGFMLLQCGLGAYALALLHIVGHSLYKAHAFLSSGSIVDAMKNTPRSPAPVPSTALAIGSAVFAVGLAGAVGVTLAPVLGATTGRPDTLTLAAVLALAVTHLLLQGRGSGAAGMLRVASLAVMTIAAYFAFAAAAHALFATAVASPSRAPGLSAWVLPGLVVLAFAVAFVLQARLPALAAHPSLRAVYVHLSQGLYVNAHVNRIVQTVWPIVPPARRPSNRGA